MGYSSFCIRSYNQDIKIKNELIEATNDGFRSALRVFVGLDLKLDPKDKDVSYHCLVLMAKLSLDGRSLYLSEDNVSFSEEISAERRETGIWLNFYLDEKALLAIQKYRDNGDVKLMIKFEISAILRRKAITSTAVELHGAETLKGEIQFDIPKSLWVEKIVQKLGYTFRLFEIPLTHSLLQEAYDDIISEFILAEKYFNQLDYNKSIAHCRNAMDGLSQNLKKLKDANQSRTAFDWLKNIDNATLTWIDEIHKATSAISSKSHHIGLKKDFTRVEAESIYLVTLGLMNFVGQANTDFS